MAIAGCIRRFWLRRAGQPGSVWTVKDLGAADRETGRWANHRMEDEQTTAVAVDREEARTHLSALN
jgi:hypothetical protein